MQHSVDSINWPPEFSDLKRLDVILKCGICYDFMNTCMITSCSHTYCSLCIRKFMLYKSQCPICFEETFETSLRNNRLLDEVILIYTNIRDKLLRASRLASVTIPVKNEAKERKSENREISSSITDTKLIDKVEKEQGQDKVNANPATDVIKEENISNSKTTIVDDVDAVVVNGVKIPGIFTSPKVFSARPRRPDELSSCPVCQVKVPARNINIHLDSCLALDQAARPKPKVKKRSPLPKRVYTMMPEKALKKVLKEYGLHTNGDRKVLIARLQRYTVIYNAENDAVNPRPVSELIKQLEREEREEKKPNSIIQRPVNPSNFRIGVSKHIDIAAAEKTNTEYRKENKASFMKLIEEMRAREGRNIKPLKPTNRIYSDDESDVNKLDSASGNDQPTTSAWTSEVVTVCSDSDGDIFLESDTEKKSTKKGKIDWNKTSAQNQGTAENQIYDLPTQRPTEEFNHGDSDDDEDEEEEDEAEEEDSDEVEEGTDESYSPEFPDSDNSSLDISLKQNNRSKLVKDEKKSRKKSEKSRRMLSLLWTKNNEETLESKRKVKKSDDIELKSIEEDATIYNDDNPEEERRCGLDIVDDGEAEIVQENNSVDIENVNTNIIEDSSNSSAPNNDINEDSNSNSSAPNHDYNEDSSNSNSNSSASNNEVHLNGNNIEVVSNGHVTSNVEPIDTDMVEPSETTPLRRSTRSAKRKTDQESKDLEHPTTPVTTRKRSKRDLSPAF